MATRSILSIDLDDAKFKKFSDTFAHYQKLLKGTPGEWKKVTDTVGGTRTAFEALVAAQTASIAKAKLLNEAQKEAERRSRTLADDWHKLAGHAKSFAGHIVHATRSILSWGALTTAISGVLGIGGLWGLDRLAQVASSGRRSALGLGLTYGEQRAFGINYSRAVDPGQFLGGVNQALHDLQARPALYGAGLTEGDLRGRDTAQVASLVIQRLKPILDRTPESQLGQLLQARHLGALGLGVQDLERIKALSPAELGDYQKHFGSDAVRLNLTQRELIAWQRLQVQLTRAGDTIETTFIRGLTPLAPELAKLSKGFSDIVDALMKSPAVKQWIQDFADGMGSLAKWIGTPQFKQDVIDFVQGIGQFTSAVIDAAKKIVGFFGGGTPAPGGQGSGPSNPVPPSPGETPPAIGGWGFDWKTGKWVYRQGQDTLGRNPNDTATPPNGGKFNPGDPGWKYSPDKGWHYDPASIQGSFQTDVLLQKAAAKYGVPIDVMRAVAQQESGSGTRGRYLMGVSAGPGAFNPDPEVQADQGAQILARLFRRYGNWTDALSVYNSGKPEAGNAMGHNYVEAIGRVLRSQHPQAPNKVYVYDRTGGSVIVSGAQLAV